MCVLESMGAEVSVCALDVHLYMRVCVCAWVHVHAYVCLDFVVLLCSYLNSCLLICIHTGILYEDL